MTRIPNKKYDIKISYAVKSNLYPVCDKLPVIFYVPKIPISAIRIFEEDFGKWKQNYWDHYKCLIWVFNSVWYFAILKSWWVKKTSQTCMFTTHNIIQGEGHMPLKLVVYCRPFKSGSFVHLNYYFHCFSGFYLSLSLFTYVDII